MSANAFKTVFLRNRLLRCPGFLQLYTWPACLQQQLAVLHMPIANQSQRTGIHSTFRIRYHSNNAYIILQMDSVRESNLSTPLSSTYLGAKQHRSSCSTANRKSGISFSVNHVSRFRSRHLPRAGRCVLRSVSCLLPAP